MPLRRIGENVPDVTCPAALPSTVTTMPGRGMPRPSAPMPRSSRAGPASLRQECVTSPERRLVPPDGPARPRLHRTDVQGQVLAVQRIAHLGAQRVSRPEPAGQDAVRRTGGEQRIPDRHRGVPRHHQLVAALTGVAGPAHRHGCSLHDATSKAM